MQLFLRTFWLIFKPSSAYMFKFVESQCNNRNHIFPYILNDVYALITACFYALIDPISLFCIFYFV